MYDTLKYIFTKTQVSNATELNSTMSQLAEIMLTPPPTLSVALIDVTAIANKLGVCKGWNMCHGSGIKMLSCKRLKVCVVQCSGVERCSVVQCVAVRGSVLLCVAVCCVRKGLSGNGSMDTCHESGFKMLSCKRLKVRVVQCGGVQRGAVRGSVW